MERYFDECMRDPEFAAAYHEERAIIDAVDAVVRRAQARSTYPVPLNTKRIAELARAAVDALQQLRAAVEPTHNGAES